MQSRITYKPAALARATAVSSVASAVWLKPPRLVGSKSLHFKTKRAALKPLLRISSYFALPQVLPTLSFQTGVTLKPFSGTGVPFGSTNASAGVECRATVAPSAAGGTASMTSAAAIPSAQRARSSDRIDLLPVSESEMRQGSDGLVGTFPRSPYVRRRHPLPGCRGCRSALPGPSLLRQQDPTPSRGRPPRGRAAARDHSALGDLRLILRTLPGRCLASSREPTTDGWRAVT